MLERALVPVDGNDRDHEHQPQEEQKMSQQQVQDLLKLAESDDITSEELARVWDSTTSPRVRKAVASNPNASTALMCAAARLYIKEVINNTSFTVKSLFASDPVVKDIYEAYTDPAQFLNSIGGSLHKVKSHNREVICRALVTSPKINNVLILEQVLSMMKTAEFFRELKDSDVRQRVSDVVNSNMSKLYFSNRLTFLNKGVAKQSEFINSIDQDYNSRKEGCIVLSRREMLNTFEMIRQKADYKTLFQFISMCGSYSLRHLVKSLDEMRITDDLLKDFADLYRDQVLNEIKKDVTKVRRHHYYSMQFGDSRNSCHLSDLCWGSVMLRNGLDTGDFESVDLEAVFKDLKMIGFHTDYGPYKTKLQFKGLDLLTGKNEICRKLLALKSDEAFEFYMTCNILWDNWYAKSAPGNLESQVVDRMHAINQSKGFKYYRWSSLGDYPRIVISNSFGINYNSKLYYSIKDRDSIGYPAGSSRISI
jgi:hypothetical protein